MIDDVSTMAGFLNDAFSNRVTMNRVALLIPVYDDQAGLEYSLSTLPLEVPLDIVVVDDGSTPPVSLTNIPKPHQGILLRLEENQGIEHALNSGLKWILDRNYLYIARLDAGDVALAGRFSKQLAFLESNPQYALVGGQVRFVDDIGKQVLEESLPTDFRDIRRIMHARCCIIHPSVMFRSSIFGVVGPYSDQYKAGEDFELFFRILRQFPIANLEDDVILYHVNPMGISLKNRKRQIISRLRIMWKFFDPTIPESYLGLIKNSLLLIVPVSIIISLKRLLKRNRGWL